MTETTESFDLASVPSLRDVIEEAESYLLCVAIDDVRRAFWRLRFDETATMSEDLGQTVALPSGDDYRRMDAAYKAALAQVQPCSGVGYKSWTCREAHTALNYAHMLLRAIAYGYGLPSEGQPRSELWWQEFNEVTA
jgi:hypothetical protein